MGRVERGKLVLNTAWMILLLTGTPAPPAGIRPAAVLASELLAEGDWRYARIEIERGLAETPDDPHLLSLRARLPPSRALPARTVGGTRTAERPREHRTAPVGRSHRRTAAPFVAAVRFYRRHIGPAIGARCALHPSCSAYGLAALHTHGLLGLPLIADRAVREPGLVAARHRPVIVNGHRRFYDPLHDHDWWLDP